MPKRLDMRIAVGSAAGPRSTIWRIFSHSNDVYATHRTSGQTEKISFHASRLCRRAFLSTHRLPADLADRVMHRWRRADTPPAQTGRATAVLSIDFPAAHLTESLSVPTKKITWIPAAPLGNSVNIQLMYTNDTQDEFEQQIAPSGRELLHFHSLPNGEAMAITRAIRIWECETIIMGVRPGDEKEIVLPGVPTPGRERPILVSVYHQPDELCCYEFSGFELPVGQGRTLFPDAGVLSRDRILDRGTFAS